MGNKRGKPKNLGKKRFSRLAYKIANYKKLI